MRPDSVRTHYRPAVHLDQGEVRAVSAAVYRYGILSDGQLSAADIIGVNADHCRNFRYFWPKKDVAAALDSSAVSSFVLLAFADRIAILFIRDSFHMLIRWNKYKTGVFDLR